MKSFAAFHIEREVETTDRSEDNCLQKRDKGSRSRYDQTSHGKTALSVSVAGLRIVLFYLALCSSSHHYLTFVSIVDAFGLPPGAGGGLSGMYGHYGNPESVFLAIMVKLSEESEKRSRRIKKSVRGRRRLLGGGGATNKGFHALPSNTNDNRISEEAKTVFPTIGTETETQCSSGRSESKKEEESQKNTEIVEQEGDRSTISRTIFTVYANDTDDVTPHLSTSVISFSDSQGEFVRLAMETVRQIMRKFCIISRQQLFHTPADNVLWKRAMIFQRIQGFLVALVYGSMVYKFLHSFKIYNGIPRQKRQQAHRPSIW